MFTINQCTGKDLPHLHKKFFLGAATDCPHQASEPLGIIGLYLGHQLPNPKFAFLLLRKRQQHIKCLTAATRTQQQPCTIISRICHLGVTLHNVLQLGRKLFNFNYIPFIQQYL